MLKNNRFINSKLKARISLMLSDDFFYRLIRCGTLQEAVQLLKGTEYEIVNSCFSRTGDLKMGELGLFSREIEFYTEFESFFPNYLRIFVNALLMKYEIDVLKSAIRLWFDKNFRGRNINNRIGYIYRKSVINTIFVDQVINASSLLEISEILSETPYFLIIESNNDSVTKYKSLFLLETALDIFYFTELSKSIGKLGIKDKKIAGDYYSFVIDIENIKWADRFKGFDFYKEIDPSRIFIPNGKAISKVLFQKLLLAVDVDFINLIQPLFPYIAPTYSGSHIVDSYIDSLEKQLKNKIKRMLRGDPFSIGIMIAYFNLKQDEISKLIMILNAISYGLSEKRIKELL